VSDRTLRTLQAEFGPWVDRNFGTLKEVGGDGLTLAEFCAELRNTNEIACTAAAETIEQLAKRLDRVVTTLGGAEEFGELARAVVKMEDGIRGTREEWLAELSKELGDTVLKCCGIAHRHALDLHDCVWNRWADGPKPIRERDWTTDKKGHGLPQNG